MRYEILSYSFFVVAWVFIIISDAILFIPDWNLLFKVGTLVLLNFTLIAQTSLAVRLMRIVSESMG